MRTRREGKMENKALKSSRPAYGSTNEHQDLREENKRSNSKSNPESESMWESDMVDSVLSPNPQKKGGKIKNKVKNNNSSKISQTPDKKTDSKGKLQKSNESIDSKSCKKDHKKKEKEEIKQEFNQINLKQNNSVPVVRNSPQKDPHQKQNHQGNRSYNNKGKKHDKTHLINGSIPQEAVSSFYQCEKDYSEPKYFENVDHFQRNNSYNYYQDNHNFTQDHQYMDNNMNYYPPDQNMMYQQVDPAAQRQFDCEHFLYKTLSKEILAEANRIRNQVTQISEYRLDIKKEIERVALDTFNSRYSAIEAHIYGSVATGLALPESDMDIVITGVGSEADQILHKSDLTLLFNQIIEKFSKKLIVKKLLITETSVPIIKLSFDLIEYYKEVTKSDPSRLPLVDFSKLDKSLNTLAVDISLAESADGTDHHGIKAAHFVQNCLLQYPILIPVCLMLKKLLVLNGFNDPYTGGLGSFSLFLMLYSSYFLETMNSVESFHTEESHPARLFSWFLTYFGDYFDMDKMAIIFIQGNIPLTMLKAYCGQSDDSGEVRLCVLDPIAQSNNCFNNTTYKVWRILDIKTLFSETKKKIFKEYIDIYKGYNEENEPAGISQKEHQILTNIM